MIDLEAFRQTPLRREPFDSLVLPRFIQTEALPSIVEDFPRISRGGSFPLSSLSYGPSFAAFVATLRGRELEKAVAEKFEIDLTDRPTMITVRGRARKKDGRIHSDSRSKLITVLIYMNAGWTSEGGALRLLRSKDSLEDFFAEIKPELGTTVFFRCAPNAWHGHTPFVGERRAVQLNWVTDAAVVKREQARHGLSARLKRVVQFGR